MRKSVSYTLYYQFGWKKIKTFVYSQVFSM